MAPSKKSRKSTAAFAIKVILTIVAVVVVIILETTWPSEVYKPVVEVLRFYKPKTTTEAPTTTSTPTTTTVTTTTTPTTTTKATTTTTTTTPKPTTKKKTTTTRRTKPSTTRKKRQRTKEGKGGNARFKYVPPDRIHLDRGGTVLDWNKDEPHRRGLGHKATVFAGNKDEPYLPSDRIQRHKYGTVLDANDENSNLPSDRFQLGKDGTVFVWNAEDEPYRTSDIVDRSEKGPAVGGNVDELSVAPETVQRRKKKPVFDGDGNETPQPPSVGAGRVVSMATRKQGVRNRIGLTLGGDSWPQESPFPYANLKHAQRDVGDKNEDNPEEDYALIHRVDYTTYTLLHASVYAYIGVFVALIATYLFGDNHPPLESTLMFAGVVLHVVTICPMCVFASNFIKRSLHYNLTIAVILLMVVMTLLMLLDCWLMWSMEGKGRPRKRMRKPRRQRST